jgi:hypothetical protein
MNNLTADVPIPMLKDKNMKKQDNTTLQSQQAHSYGPKNCEGD